MKDAITNISGMGLLTSAFYSGDYSALRIALNDRLHQPYRKSLIAHFDDVIQAFYNCGAYGACLSGAGPTILAFVDKADAQLAARVAQKTKNFSGNWNIVSSDFDRRGALSKNYLSTALKMNRQNCRLIFYLLFCTIILYSALSPVLAAYTQIFPQEIQIFLAFSHE